MIDNYQSMVLQIYNLHHSQAERFSIREFSFHPFIWIKTEILS